MGKTKKIYNFFFFFFLFFFLSFLVELFLLFFFMFFCLFFLSILSAGFICQNFVTSFYWYYLNNYNPHALFQSKKPKSLCGICQARKFCCVRTRHTLSIYQMSRNGWTGVLARTNDISDWHAKPYPLTKKILSFLTPYMYTNECFYNVGGRQDINR